MTFLAGSGFAADLITLFSQFLLYDDHHYWCRDFMFVTLGLAAPEFSDRVEVI
jgi:hypothetical protein